jgi:hypothetical protein
LLQWLGIELIIRKIGWINTAECSSQVSNYRRREHGWIRGATKTISIFTNWGFEALM